MSARHGSEKHHRRSIRLKGFDYSRAGAYFVTICVQDRACVFGNVVDGKMRQNNAGRMIGRWWMEMNHGFSNVKTDEYVVMPNHFHGIVFITEPFVGADLCVRPSSDALVVTDPVNNVGRGAHAGAPDNNRGAHANNRGAHAGAPLPRIVQWFKTMTTNEYIRGVKTAGWPPFPGRLWQRNYYEEIIRNDVSLNRIREYIANNPVKWETDRENPAARQKNT